MYDSGGPGKNIPGTTTVSHFSTGTETKNGVRIVITGKGGVGKTTIPALLAPTGKP